MRPAGQDDTKGRKVAREAVSHRGKEYDKLTFLRLGLTGKMPDVQINRFICSTLCERALIAGGANLVKKKAEPVTPSFLSRALEVVLVASLPVQPPC
jgi:hypothetical protein